MILIAANELRGYEAPSNAPKEDPCHITPDPSSTPVWGPHVQDQEEPKGKGVAVNKPSGVPAENMSEALGEDAHKIAQSGGSLE